MPDKLDRLAAEAKKRGNLRHPAKAILEIWTRAREAGGPFAKLMATDPPPEILKEASETGQPILKIWARTIVFEDVPPPPPDNAHENAQGIRAEPEDEEPPVESALEIKVNASDREGGATSARASPSSPLPSSFREDPDAGAHEPYRVMEKPSLLVAPKPDELPDAPSWVLQPGEGDAQWRERLARRGRPYHEA